MATNKKTAGKTANKATKNVKTDTPDMDVKVVMIDDDTAKLLSGLKTDLMMHTVVIGILTGALSDREITEQHRRECIHLGSAVYGTMQKKYGFEELQLLGATVMIAQENMPTIHDEVKKELEAERKSKNRSEKKEAK